MKYYIAYGSNLNKEHFARLCPGAVVAAAGTLNGWRMVFRGSGDGFSYATVEPCEGCGVPVGIWRIEDEHEADLDRYEGFPDLYYKRTITASTPAGEISGMIYIMTEGYDLARPSRSYIDTVRDGYESFGFDRAVIDAALEASGCGG